MGYLSAGLLQQLEGLSDEVAQIQPLSLVVVDFVTYTCVVVPEDVEDGQDLPVVGHQGLPYHLA